MSVMFPAEQSVPHLSTAATSIVAAAAVVLAVALLVLGGVPPDEPAPQRQPTPSAVLAPQGAASTD